VKNSDFVGLWRILKMSEWDKNYCDMEVKAYIKIARGGVGEFQFGLVYGDISGEFISKTKRFDFSGKGNDECDEASGDGWMEIKEGGKAEGEIRFHAGDKSYFWAEKSK